MQMAMFANAHRGEDVAAFTPEDFLGTGDHASRQKQYGLDKVAAWRERRKIARILPGKPTEDVPAWAIGPYQGKANN